MNKEQITILLYELRKDNREAFNKIFYAYYSRLVGFAGSILGSQQDAEDVVSTFFVNLWQKRTTLPTIIYPETYLYTSVKNACLNYKRDHKKIMSIHEQQFVKSEPAYEDSAGTKELNKIIDLAIQSLPEQRRIVFKLVKENGMKYKEAVDDVRDTTASTYNYAEDRVEKTGGGMKWLLPLLLIAALLLALWYFFGKGCNNGTGTATDDTTVVSDDDTINAIDGPATTIAGNYDSVSGNYIYDVGSDKEITLADGTKMTVGSNSTEAKLYEFLNSGTVDSDKTKGWITLDRVYFETGKSVLTTQSQTQLKNIASILKNFATAKVKMGGYTDNTGSADANVKLSGERAKTAASELVKLGVAAANVESEGYGQEHPVCAANDSPECKAQNRRVDIRVAAK